MKLKKYLVFLFLLSVFFINSQDITINRDKTPIKEGPGPFFNNLVFLKINTVVKNLGPSNEDDGWIKVSFKGRVDNKDMNIVGYLSRLSISERQTSSDPFSSLRGSTSPGGSAVNQITPGAYTAAIKGFLQNYSGNKFGNYDYDDIYMYTSFTLRDYNQFKNRNNLSYFPRRGELLGLQNTHITESIEALSGAVVISALSKYELVRTQDSIKLNVIANILNRQTVDYDKRYNVWIVKEREPFAFSGPGGAIFISDGMVRLLDDNELIAVIAHEIGHIAMRHGVRDIAIDQARRNMQAAYDEFDSVFGESEASLLSKDLENIITDALKTASLVRDDIQEFEADEIAMELLRRYRLDRKVLASALRKVFSNLNSSQMLEYKRQTERRLARIR